MSAASAGVPVSRRRWLGRLGMAGFAFFFVKGLLWLIAPFVFYWLT